MAVWNISDRRMLRLRHWLEMLARLTPPKMRSFGLPVSLAFDGHRPASMRKASASPKSQPFPIVGTPISGQPSRTQQEPEQLLEH